MSAKSAASVLSKTPLYESHVKYAAKFGPYAGFNMPLIYKHQSHIDSHKWVRTKVGLFDVSHMLQHHITGANARKFLEKITPIDLGRLAPNTSSLSVLLNKDGGIVDDTIITKHSEDHYYMVTNAGCREKDMRFMSGELEQFSEVAHHPFEGTLLAIQGPGAASLLQKYTSEDLSRILFGQAKSVRLRGIVDADVHVSRTGYTGEDGFELSIPSSTEQECAQARGFFEHLIDDHADLARPIGLAARDSLRLEAGMCLYGNELTEDITPVEATLSWLVPKTRRSGPQTFNGSGKILLQLADKKLVPRRRIGIVSKGPAPRAGTRVLHGNGTSDVGYVTSGSPSPTLGVNVSQCYVDKEVKVGDDVQLDVRGKLRDGKLVKLPFVETRFYKGP